MSSLILLSQNHVSYHLVGHLCITSMEVYSCSHSWIKNAKLEAGSVIAITIFSMCGLGIALEKDILILS